MGKIASKATLRIMTRGPTLPTVYDRMPNAIQFRKVVPRFFDDDIADFCDFIERWSDPLKCHFWLTRNNNCQCSVIVRNVFVRYDPIALPLQLFSEEASWHT